MNQEEATPALPHLTSEFFVWLWYASERDEGTITVTGGEDVDVWVDDRISFRMPSEDRARAVLTGENPASTLEARAALAGGKLVRDLRIGLRRAEREYAVTLRGVHLDLQSAAFPPVASGAEEERLYERMFLYEELWWLLGALYTTFAVERVSESWQSETRQAIVSWAAGVAGEP